MALKRKIDADTYNALSEVNKALYIESSGKYILDLEDDDATGALKRAKERSAQEAKEAKAKAEELQAQIDELTGNDAKKRGDVAALEKAWQDKLSKELGARDTKLNARDAYISSLLVDNVAKQIANRISNAPDLLLPHIKSRLKANLEGEMPVTEILDSTGALSKMTLAELEADIIGDKRYAPVIIATKASGSTGAQTIVAAPSGSSGKVDLNKLTPKEIGALFAPK
jgi:hypothetical protein